MNILKKLKNWARNFGILARPMRIFGSSGKGEKLHDGGKNLQQKKAIKDSETVLKGCRGK